jgi:hypothetical protein
MIMKIIMEATQLGSSQGIRTEECHSKTYTQISIYQKFDFYPDPYSWWHD